MSPRIVKPKPIDRESEFNIEEIFFSTTDLVGNITAGNNVFVRVSQYDKADLLGAPHNIIRHPDMPKLVFKVLWDYLKADKPVCAYVKNMTKEGRYYWVLATAFPVPNGYLSIRIKPSSEILKLMPEVYNLLLDAEDKGGMDASLKLLLEILKSKGFDDYDSFMSAILMAELNSREALIKNIDESNKRTTKSAFVDAKQDQLIEGLREIKTLCEKISLSFDKLFSSFDNLLSVDKTLKNTSMSILDFSQKISILSLNAKLNSNFEGEAGRTLTIVANTISVSKAKVEIDTKSIVGFSKEISKYTQKLSFQTSAPRLQSAMIKAFAQELYEQSLVRMLEPAEIDELKKNILVLIDLFVNSFSQLNDLLKPIGKDINEILGIIQSINKAIYDLDLCSFLGKIEAAKIDEKGEKFNITFAEIKDCSETIKDSLLEFQKYLKSIIVTTDTIQEFNTQILSEVMLIKDATQKI